MTAWSLYRPAVLLACGMAAASPVGASAAPVGSGAAPGKEGPSACASHAAEAALRSRLSETVLLRVMHVESRGRAHAISPKGAMGCMQIMPATWRYLTARHGLGTDPWNARFNMIGGALYLSELARQFGFPGAYAAYNAGPARYARHVRGAASLPAETVAYMASLSRSAPPWRPDAQRVAVPAPRWQDAQLFLRAESQRAMRDDALRTAPSDGAPTVSATATAKTMNVRAERMQEQRRSPRSEIFPFARSGADRTEGDAHAE